MEDAWSDNSRYGQYPKAGYLQDLEAQSRERILKNAIVNNIDVPRRRSGEMKESSNAEGHIYPHNDENDNEEDDNDDNDSIAEAMS